MNFVLTVGAFRREIQVRYQYQIDYGNGYEDFYPHVEDANAHTGEESPLAWLASVEAEGTALRARVMMNGEVIEERNFVCVVAQSRIEPNGDTRYTVQCPGGQITVERRAGGELSGDAQSGYVGDTDLALQRAFDLSLIHI